MNSTKQVVWMLAMLIAAAGSAMAQGQTSSGTLNATLINKSGIWIVFNTDPAGVTLSNSGTSAAGLTFGTVAKYMTTPPAGVTLARTATNFTVSTPFDVFVDVGGVASASYRLQAALQSPAGVYTYMIDAVTLSTTAATLVAADPNYRANVQHTMSLTVPSTAPAGLVSNTVNFTVTAN
jgi:hypothetical protein